ncbi:acyl-CoA thioesterase [Peribacillus tepidiphilus]|uniref:acyl-CoA thioesterase n=1 Tax=Peribacillus tepidiphilus TaxID=2652445 RepID=UPI001291C2DA|nr:thioesterase family protein [Peribacillus tepidiphilus]
MYISEKEIEVRYAETDQMGVVYHANYLVWMELGRTKIVKDLGFNYTDMEKDGVISPVLNVNINYLKSVRYGENVKIKTWIEKYDGIRTTYGYEIVNEKNEICATATSDHVCVKKENFRPISIKRLYPDWHEVYEKNKKTKQEKSK